MNNLLEKNREIKLSFLKSLSFDVKEDDSSIEVIYSDQSLSLMNQIRNAEPDFNFDVFVDSVIRTALEESLKEYENKS